MERDKQLQQIYKDLILQMSCKPYIKSVQDEFVWNAISPQVIAIIKTHFNLGETNIFYKSRERKFTIPRHLYRAFMLHIGFSLSFAGIKILCDHATMLHSFNVVNNWMQTDKNFNAEYHILKE